MGSRQSLTGGSGFKYERPSSKTGLVIGMRMSAENFWKAMRLSRFMATSFQPDIVPLTDKVPKWYREQGVDTVEAPIIGFPSARPSALSTPTTADCKTPSAPMLAP